MILRNFIKPIIQTLQAVVVWSNKTPLVNLWRLYYTLSLERVLKDLAGNPDVIAVYGHGSFFEDSEHLIYGVSDLDLDIVLGPQVDRTYECLETLKKTFRRARRFFPFLGSVEERESGLNFLSEVSSGIPVPLTSALMEPDRCRLLLGEPHWLEHFKHGQNDERHLAHLNSLLAQALKAPQGHSSRLLFWKKLLGKALNRARALGLHGVADRWENASHMEMLQKGSNSLFFEKADRTLLFNLLLEFVSEVHRSIGCDQECPLRVERSTAELPSPLRDRGWRRGGAVSALAQIEGTNISWVEAPLLGPEPRFSFLPVDRQALLLTFHRIDYEKIRKAIEALADSPYREPGMLMKMGDVFFFASPSPDKVELLPLCPVTSPQFFAEVHQTPTFPIATRITRAQQERATGLFLAQSDLYGQASQGIRLHAFPALYLSDDLPILHQAFYHLRVFLYCNEGVDYATSFDLMERMKSLHPKATDFLEETYRYYLRLQGVEAAPTSPKPPNNLFKTLLRFMQAVLKGQKDLSIDGHHAHLGVTVGIITRNREASLSRTLESLEGLSRKPEQVIIVDNGSTDTTRERVEAFSQRLPLLYDYLEQPSIPLARNRVIELAEHEVIAFTDDDCVVDSDWLLEVESAFLRADNIGLVGGSVCHRPESTESALDEWYRLFIHGGAGNGETR